MKNIHILPTDKPSRLRYNLSNVLVVTKELYRDYGKEVNQNIYITSDGEIKERDWCIDVIHNAICKRNSDNYRKQYKKIILTTDPDLIKNGVQAIPDDFLEWFIENQGCEFVEVEREKSVGYTEDRARVFYGKLKIIIPKEEPNPFELPKALPDDVFFKSLEEPKQETLEEAALKYARHNASGYFVESKVKAFEEGAKWQAERMYSEEEVIELLKTFDIKFNSGIVERNKGIKEWFEQFKKK
jgi:hypothetical protein